MDKLWEMLPLMIFFPMVAYIVKISLDHKIRRDLIEKGQVNESAKYLYQSINGNHSTSSLKWGMILLAIGLAVLIGRLAVRDYRGEITIALMLIFPGLALVIFYFIAGHVHKKSKEDEPIQ
jgi:hypothetical protein